MSIIILIIIRVVIQGLLFWGVMKLFDRDNTRNTLPMAFVMGFVFSFGGWLSYGSLGILRLAGIGILLTKYYEFGIGEMILFLIIFFLISLGIGYLLSLIPGL